MKSWEYCAKLFGSYYTFFIAVIVNLSMVIGGISFAWSSPVLVKLDGMDDNPLGHTLTLRQSELIGSLIFIGGTIGPLLFIKSADLLGRKKTLVITTIPGAIGYGILTFANRVEFYFVARFLIGLSIGSATNLSPPYLAEIVFSVKNRSSYMAISPFSMHIGYLISYIIGPYVSMFIYNGLIFMLSIFVTFGVWLGCPESPYYVLGMKGRSATINILEKLDVVHVEDEAAQIEKDIKESPENSLMALFKNKRNLKTFLMVTCLFMFQQLSGVVILLSYSQEIFLKSASSIPSEICTIIVGIVQVLSAAIATITVRKFARKSLLYFSLIGGAILNIILAIYYRYEDKFHDFKWIPLVATILYVITFNSGLDPVPWMYLGEIYALNVRSYGTAITASFSWFLMYLLSYGYFVFPLSEMFSAYLIFSIMGTFFVKFALKETKGKTLREIQEDLAS